MNEIFSGDVIGDNSIHNDVENIKEHNFRKPLLLDNLKIEPAIYIIEKNEKLGLFNLSISNLEDKEKDILVNYFSSCIKQKDIRSDFIIEKIDTSHYYKKGYFSYSIYFEEHE